MSTGYPNSLRTLLIASRISRTQTPGMFSSTSGLRRKVSNEKVQEVLWQIDSETSTCYTLIFQHAGISQGAICAVHSPCHVGPLAIRYVIVWYGVFEKELQYNRQIVPCPALYQEQSQNKVPNRNCPEIKKETI